MFSGSEFLPESIVGPQPDVATSAVVHMRRFSLDEMPPVLAPTAATVFDDWFPQGRDHARRLQAAIDELDAQSVVLNELGEIAAVNRVWRMTADLNGLRAPARGVGLNYLAVCRTAAADGCRDAAATAEGIEAVCAGRLRSFYYQYAWRGDGRKLYYGLRAVRAVIDGENYVVVGHELLEAHGYSSRSA